MFDVRYHLVSLVAVFLALALGILMGSVIAGRGTLVERQNALIEGIQADVNRIQKENKGLHEELKNSENL
ncbi:MAG TPA: copper transporter, partial [Candidatus Subteraquimicrobiales bacterium]